MTYAVDKAFTDAILIRVLRELRLPETLPLNKLSLRMKGWILREAEGLRRDAMTHPIVAVLLKCGLPLTRKNYLIFNNVDEEDLDAELETELPHLFQESMVEASVASVMLELEIDDALRRLSGLAH